MNYALDVFVSGNYAYVADGYGLAVIDISDPTNPGSPVYENATEGASGVYVSGDYAYVTSSARLAVVDISDPTNLGNLELIRWNKKKKLKNLCKCY